MSSLLQTGSQSHDVYVGFWTNWSSGKIKGATITLTRRDGGLLVAFLALFVATAGRSLWRILCFALHHYLSSPFSPQDGLYHQRQALLRNTEGAASAVWQLIQMIFVWKKSKAADHVYRRLLPTIAAGITVSLCFAIAGIFSSNVTTNDGNEVLLTGSKCGILDLATLLDNITILDAARSQDARRAQGFFDYVRNCYGDGDTTNADRCRFYVKPRLSLQANRNASCPFADEICRSTTGNLELDTGYIDSHDDLGINAPPKDRFSLRVVHRCAPLKTEGYSEVETEVDQDNDNKPVDFTRVYYGSWTNMTFPEYRNYTFQKSMPHTRTMSKYSLGLPAECELGFVESYSANSQSRAIRYEPIPELQVEDADLVLFFLSAPFIVYQEEVDDPWFSAHRPGPPSRSLVSGEVTRSHFMKDEMISTVACTTQQQVCNPNTKGPEQMRCEDLRGEYVDYEESTSRLWDSKEQKMAFDWIYRIFKRSRLTVVNLVQFGGSTALAARHSLFSSSQAILPSNQWQIEMENIVSASLASLQDVFAGATEGPPITLLEAAWAKPAGNDTAANRMCENQKIISAQFFSFSVLGLALILTIGSLFIVLELCLEPMMERKLIKSSKYRNFDGKLPPKSRGEIERTGTDTTLTTRSGLENIDVKNGDITKVEEKDNEYNDQRKSSDEHIESCMPEVVAPTYSPKAAKYMEWNANSIFQLQRLAHEGVDCGTWQRTSSNIPVTLPRQTLAVIGFKDEEKKHLRLVPHK